MIRINNTLFGYWYSRWHWTDVILAELHSVELLLILVVLFLRDDTVFLQFIPFKNTQVSLMIEIILHRRQDPFIIHGCWWPCDTKSCKDLNYAKPDGTQFQKSLIWHPLRFLIETNNQIWCILHRSTRRIADCLLCCIVNFKLTNIFFFKS